MKKTLIIIFSAFLVSAQETQQTREVLNVFASIGIGFKTGGQLFTSITENPSTEVPGERIIVGEENEFFNYGQGFKINLGAQYLAMENLGLQLDFEISLGAPGFETDDHLIDAAGARIDSTTEYTRNMYGIKFLVVPRFEVLELITMYTGVGIGFFWNSNHYDITRSVSTGTTTEKGRIVSSPTLGWTGLIGGDYPVSDRIALFGEIAFDQVVFKWKKRIIEQTNIPGKRVGTTFFEEDDPSNEEPLKVPGSNWQIRIGARFSIL